MCYLLHFSQYHLEEEMTHNFYFSVVHQWKLGGKKKQETHVERYCHRPCNDEAELVLFNGSDWRPLGGTMDGLRTKPTLEHGSRLSVKGTCCWNQDVWLLGESKVVNSNEASKASTSTSRKRAWSSSQQTEIQELGSSCRSGSRGLVLVPGCMALMQSQCEGLTIRRNVLIREEVSSKTCSTCHQEINSGSLLFFEV